MSNNINSNHLDRIRKYIQEHPPFQIKDPANIPISVDDPQRDKMLMTNNLMRELCEMDKYARRNGYSTEFSIENIKSIQAFGKQIIENFIKEFQKDSQYIEILPDGRIKLTDNGRNSCHKFGV